MANLLSKREHQTRDQKGKNSIKACQPDTFRTLCIPIDMQGAFFIEHYRVRVRGKKIGISAVKRKKKHRTLPHVTSCDCRLTLPGSLCFSLSLFSFIRVGWVVGGGGDWVSLCILTRWSAGWAYDLKQQPSTRGMRAPRHYFNLRSEKMKEKTVAQRKKKQWKM